MGKRQTGTPQRLQRGQQIRLITQRGVESRGGGVRIGAVAQGLEMGVKAVVQDTVADRAGALRRGYLGGSGTTGTHHPAGVGDANVVK